MAGVKDQPGCFEGVHSFVYDPYGVYVRRKERRMGNTLASEGKRYGFDPKLLEQMLQGHRDPESFFGKGGILLLLPTRKRKW
jgi:hypothetical protein